MAVREILLWLLCIVGGFTLGGVMFSDIIPKHTMNKDICALSDDHNPGATNVFIQCGIPCGVLCLFLDVLKGYLPVWFGCRYLDTDNMLFAAVLAAPVLGHAVAPLHHFHGGKCISTAFGEMLALLKVSYIGTVLAGLYIVFSTVVKIRPNRLRSIAVFGLFAIISSACFLHSRQYSLAVGCLLISSTAIAKHSKYFAS